MKKRIAELNKWGIFPRETVLVAGPCSAESPEQVLSTAVALKDSRVDLFRAGVWKPRTHPGSFEGAGIPALTWVKKAGRAAGLPVTVEVAEPLHVEAALKAEIDVLWIGARTTVNPFSVQAIADVLRGTDTRIMVKNPVSPDIELWIGAIERLQGVGLTRIIAVHRGFTTSRETVFRNAPNWRLPIELKTRIPGIPLVCDPSHICGKKSLIQSVAQQAVDLLFDGLMIEVHLDPTHALSDSKQQITPDQLRMLLKTLRYTRPMPEAIERDEAIKQLRKKIDTVDGQLVDLLAERMEAVRKIGELKLEQGISTYQPMRWREIMESRARRAREKGLSEEFLLRVYQHIHEEALRQQEMLQAGKKVTTNTSR